MEIKLTENIKIETDLPLFRVIDFNFFWKPGYHAMLKLRGYFDTNIQWNLENFYNSRIKIWLDDSKNTQIIYHGYITKVEIKSEEGIGQLSLEAQSASYLLDRQISKRSFQNTEKTFGEVVREAVQAEGGQVIRNRGSDKITGTPIICYEETAWQFSKRLGDRSGNYIIPDVETGNPNIWFGVRSGKEVPAFPEDKYSLQIYALGKHKGICIQVEGMDYYKIGDRMTYLGEKLIIMGVEGYYQRGELIFRYNLENITNRYVRSTHDDHTAGLELWGTVVEVKEESLRLILDIDYGKETGNHFFPWHPETGNALYAMPEIGSRAILCFYGAGERDGAVIHCMNKEMEGERNYKHRVLNIKNKNVLMLAAQRVKLSKDESHSLSFIDSAISLKTSKKLKISTKGSIRLKAARIMIDTPDEFNIYQG